MPKRKTKDTKDTKPAPAKKAKQEDQSEAPQLAPPPKVNKSEASADELIKSWFEKVRYMATDQIQAIFALNENTLKNTVACETLWTRADMGDMFVDIWNDINHGLEDEIDDHSDLVDVMLGVIEEEGVREKLLEMFADAKIDKEKHWNDAGRTLWAGWTNELKFIKL